jgi:putative Ca2+/H+ antiporter (TMEM165/GDT1 family)
VGLPHDLDDGELANAMNRKVALVLWFVGSVGAVLWTVLWACFGIFSFIYKRPTRPVVIILFIALGIWLSREGFNTFREEKNSQYRQER